MTREQKRLQLQAELEALLGSRNVYFQPPESVKMSYPAIVYELDDIQNTFANNNVHMQKYAYQITLIDSDPDSPLITILSSLPTIRFERAYRADNLNHYVFHLFY